MESNIKGLVAAGHEMASELKAECGAVDMRSVAKLISDLATQLEVQLVRANALAALEVEPIGFRCRRNDNLGDWSYVYHREPDDFERKHLVIEGIYAAPPAPVVPEEKPMPNPLSMYAVDAVAAIAEVRGWNACRAAMLQGKGE